MASLREDLRRCDVLVKGLKIWKCRNCGHRFETMREDEDRVVGTKVKCLVCKSKKGFESTGRLVF